MVLLPAQALEEDIAMVPGVASVLYARRGWAVLVPEAGGAVQTA